MYLWFYLDRQMNNQTTTARGGRGGGRVKTPSKPPRFSRNSATQSQVWILVWSKIDLQ
jgi:hypothetical protein